MISSLVQAMSVKRGLRSGLKDGDFLKNGIVTWFKSDYCFNENARKNKKNPLAMTDSSPAGQVGKWFMGHCSRPPDAGEAWVRAQKLLSEGISPLPARLA